LGNSEVELKITLSYFVEPNPGLSASIDPQRYQSFGLRFDLRRRNETLAEFRKRVNAAERSDALRRSPSQPDDDRWMLGARSISVGSLHCDVWSGPAIDLLNRDTLCIKPVNGWWRGRASKDVCNGMRRGFDGLALLVQEKLKRDPHCGHLFVFRGKRGGLVKILWHDGQGLCLFAKRLERGRFMWPRTEGEAVTITPAQLGYLLEGIDWRLPQRSLRPQAAG
jgi:IS66 Orf2 like protein